MYLSMFSPSSPTSPSTVTLISGASQNLDLVLKAIRNPLIAFVPQATLVLALGWTLEPLLGIERTAFLQTATFVVFNKVCTSQYFVWFIPFIPALIARPADNLPGKRNHVLEMTRVKALSLVAVWVLCQAAWLGSAYKLELLAQDAFLQVWACGFVLFGVSVYILGQLLESIDDPSSERIKSE